MYRRFCLTKVRRIIFLEEQLRTEFFVEANEAVGAGARIRMQPGYDHSYYFIATFIEDHLRFHASNLR